MNIKELISLINQWKEWDFSYNPYGNSIPDVFLNSLHLLKHKEKLKNIKQDGYCVSKFINDTTKETYAEKTDFVIFTKIFNKLLFENKLCPSNYISEVIKELTLYEAKHNLCLEHEVFCGYIARSMRAFASYLREIHLQSLIERYYFKKQGKNCYIPAQNFKDKIKEDTKNKTDIYLEIFGIPYRIWSYQCTESGIRCTKRRVLHSKKGVNIYIPFDINTKQNLHGWYLYNEDKVVSDIEHTSTISFNDFTSKVIKDDNFLKTVNKAFVQ